MVLEKKPCNYGLLERTSKNVPRQPLNVLPIQGRPLVARKLKVFVRRKGRTAFPRVRTGTQELRNCSELGLVGIRFVQGTALSHVSIPQIRMARWPKTDK